MLLLLSYLIKELNVTQQINKEIIIDEPEKFLHEELQAKIASVLFDLSENVNITISTHSPYMLC
jgi:predicted ATP-dependent endonuclease of OLD family